jgi:iron(III) transport system ATP-binding protein
MTRVRLDRVSKHFGDTIALDDVSLDIAAGELFFLLGPSGCGKSTLLRLIAGLHEPTGGRLWFNNRDVTNLGTERRNAVMCFQSYALWPHMSVADNVRFGLRVRGFSRKDQMRRIDEVLRMVQMKPYAHRKPNQLSGGQQQRVALARALVVNPDCLLLDEPLSNLDAKLRHEMRGEIRQICKTSGCTTIYVTHDQKEALSIADRIAVMQSGRIVQVGTPGELYHKPNSSFVADFIGHTNLLRAKLASRDAQGCTYQTAAGTIRVPSDGETVPMGDAIISIRPEQMRVANDRTPRDNRFVGKVIETTFLGEASEHMLDVGGQRVRIVSAPPRFDVHGEMSVEFDPKDVVVLER